MNKKLLFSAIIFICFFIFLFITTVNISNSSVEESKNTLETAVRRAVVQCYAIEGMYPPNIEYLEKNYGLMVDHNNFIVHYEVFASNILPDISIISLNEE